MNKLDLIFEKEPPEVQRKLMNLLIQYNAMMQYVKVSLFCRTLAKINLKSIYFFLLKLPNRKKSSFRTLNQDQHINKKNNVSNQNLNNYHQPIVHKVTSNLNGYQNQNYL